MTRTDIRPATPDDLPGLARLWHRGWHEAHAAYTPAALTALRTEADFTRRLHALLPDIRMAGPAPDPLGFCAIRDDELYQLFVTPAARGTGLAARLLANGEARLAARGVGMARLDVGIGNDLAARFYLRHGWQETGTVVTDVDSSAGPFRLRLRVFAKHVGIVD
ncbi:GNAT family N-acetyltransferase [Nioella nitratireducens]|uniref:GNAT family N-acetyltransferase n=1 Tax=Nioella nitratireducens TaxID=1287720 RepID=UPI0008FD1E66|nr:GNAT family N-acetyltransferase [Nioella nitratireducens]